MTALQFALGLVSGIVNIIAKQEFIVDGSYIIWNFEYFNVYGQNINNLMICIVMASLYMNIAMPGVVLISRNWVIIKNKALKTQSRHLIILLLVVVLAVSEIAFTMAFCFNMDIEGDVIRRILEKNAFAISFLSPEGFYPIFYGNKSADLTTEVRSIICDLIANNNVCNNTVMRSYVCKYCQSECEGKIDPDCNAFIGECKDYYNYCPYVVSQCHVSFMTSFLYKYCPVTCEQCVPTNSNDTTDESPIEIETTNSTLIDSSDNIPIVIVTTSSAPINTTDIEGKIPIIIDETSNVSLISTTTEFIPTVELLPFDNSSNIVKSTNL
uniref:ShKT domain-containing protein n=1 Tax=Strongyloides papillosus TaxID=174720 RepID=A0A0N5CI27_STREA